MDHVVLCLIDAVVEVEILYIYVHVLRDCVKDDAINV